MNRIVICKYCHRPEYYGIFHWLSGKMMCRDCYRAEYEKQYKKPYRWKDLDGKRPTMEEYKKQEEKQ